MHKSPASTRNKMTSLKLLFLLQTAFWIQINSGSMFTCSKSQELSKKKEKLFFGFTVFEIWLKVLVELSQLCIWAQSALHGARSAQYRFNNIIYDNIYTDWKYKEKIFLLSKWSTKVKGVLFLLKPPIINSILVRKSALLFCISPLQVLQLKRGILYLFVIFISFSLYLVNLWKICKNEPRKWKGSYFCSSQQSPTRF